MFSLNENKTSNKMLTAAASLIIVITLGLIFPISVNAWWQVHMGGAPKFGSLIIYGINFLIFLYLNSQYKNQSFFLFFLFTILLVVLEAFHIFVGAPLHRSGVRFFDLAALDVGVILLYGVFAGYYYFIRYPLHKRSKK